MGLPEENGGETVRTLVGASGSNARKGRRSASAALLLARCPRADAPAATDRVRIEGEVTVGRRSPAGFVVADPRISTAHFAVTRAGRGHIAGDLGSTNGTFVDGERISGRVQLEDGAVIRAGESVFVYHARADEMLAPAPPPDKRFGMAGAFHLAGLLLSLEEAALSDRAILLTGPSGVGKELAARALASMWKMDEPLAHNAARTTSEQEASRVLFGVADKAFTGVAAREGLVLAAARAGRPLFLDEVHHLPPPVQGVLLRVIEERKVQRTGGEDRAMDVEARFVLASNAPERLAGDLRARLREAVVPPLRERVADVPAIFDCLLEGALVRQCEALAGRDGGANAVLAAVDGDCYEALCLAARRGQFDEDNVRGLADLADRVATRVAAGADPAGAVDSVLAARLGGPDDEDVSHYDSQRELITAVFIGSGHNVSRTVDLLKASGVPWRCSRRHLTAYLERWGLK
jgi:hypothetical protein